MASDSKAGASAVDAIATAPGPRALASRHRIAAAIVGFAASFVPLVANAAAAAAEQGRALPQPDNFGSMVLFTALGAGGLLLLASLGRMYQRQRGIRWRFQDPDEPRHDGH